VDFKLSTTNLGNSTFCVAIGGEATLVTAPELRDALAEVLDAGARAVLVDFSGATFIDSTALGVLMGTMKNLRAVGGELALVCADVNIRRVFEMTLLDRIFAIFDTTDAGLAHVQGLGRQVSPA
jgi:anti-sigma B factor antagonist